MSMPGRFGVYNSERIEWRIDSRGRYTAAVYGHMLRTAKGKERQFGSRDAAIKAAEAHIAWLRKAVGE